MNIEKQIALSLSINRLEGMSLAFNPNEPRDNGGKWMNGGASSTKISKRKAKKISISSAAKLLKDRGYELGGPLPWKPGEDISYSVKEASTGRISSMSVKQIQGMLTK